MQGYRIFQKFKTLKILGVRHIKLTYTTEDPKTVVAMIQNLVSHLWKNFGVEVVKQQPKCFRALMDR
jgi:ribosomal protein L30/L7E